MEKETFALGLPLHKRYAILGLEKNIGKTTVLNWISRVWGRNSQSTLLLSIGRDGEEVDVIDGHTKPKIELQKGNYALTGERVLTSPALLEVVEVFSFKTLAGRPVLVKAIEDTTIELINPGGLERLTEIADQLLAQGRCDRVLLDGAFNRLSHAQRAVADSVLLVTGAQAQGTFEEILEKTVYVVERLERLPSSVEWRTRVEEVDRPDASMILLSEEGKTMVVGETSWQNPKTIAEMRKARAVYMKGALTPGIADKLLQERVKTEVILRDGPCIQLDAGLYRRMQAGGLRLSVLYPIPVIGIFVNSFGAKRSFTNGRMKGELARRLPANPVFDLFEVTETANK